MEDVPAHGQGRGSLPDHPMHLWLGATPTRRRTGHPPSCSIPVATQRATKSFARPAARQWTRIPSASWLAQAGTLSRLRRGNAQASPETFSKRQRFRLISLCHRIVSLMVLDLQAARATRQAADEAGCQATPDCGDGVQDMAFRPDAQALERGARRQVGQPRLGGLALGGLALGGLVHALAPRHRAPGLSRQGHWTMP